MNQKTLFLTSYALGRCLKEFAMRLGLDESFADGVAQLHVQQSTLMGSWSEFIIHNCSRCSKTPESCDFMNPVEANCLGGATPRDVKAANALAIESESIRKCPAYRE